MRSKRNQAESTEETTLRKAQVFRNREFYFLNELWCLTSTFCTGCVRAGIFVCTKLRTLCVAAQGQCQLGLGRKDKISDACALFFFTLDRFIACSNKNWVCFLVQSSCFSSWNCLVHWSNHTNWEYDMRLFPRPTHWKREKRRNHLHLVLRSTSVTREKESANCNKLSIDSLILCRNKTRRYESTRESWKVLTKQAQRCHSAQICMTSEKEIETRLRCTKLFLHQLALILHTMFFVLDCCKHLQLIMNCVRIVTFCLCLTSTDVAHPLLITGQEGEPTFLEGMSHGCHGNINCFILPFHLCNSHTSCSNIQIGSRTNQRSVLSQVFCIKIRVCIKMTKQLGEPVLQSDCARETSYTIS